MRLITKIQVQQVDHTQVIDSAATQVGRAANKAFLFVINKEIQGWKNFTTLISWGLSRVEQKHRPIFDEVKESAIAVFRKGCQQETAFVQALIRTQLTDRVDTRWEQHDKAFLWFKTRTQAFLADSPVEDTSDVEAEEHVPDIAEELEETAPVAEAEEPTSKMEESPVPVLDPSVDPDPLDDELSIPEDPALVPATTGSKRKSGGKSKRVTLADVMKQEAAKS